MDGAAEISVVHMEVPHYAQARGDFETTNYLVEAADDLFVVRTQRD